MSADVYISAFTPSDTDPEDLEKIFVQRKELLDDVLERVSESALTGNKHHALFIGPRGSGKTFLVSLLIHRIGKDKRVADKLCIAWLNEDETSTTLLDLLLRTHRALSERYPDEYTRGDIESVFGEAPSSAEVEVGKAILHRLSGRTLLIVAENLDKLFGSMGSEGQMALRAFIQENPVSLIATAQSLMPSVKLRTSPFYGFFQTEHLGPLDVEETAELMGGIARLEGRSGVAQQLLSERGRARVRALHHLAGGNHRIIVLLSHFVAIDGIDSLIVPFRKMVDELTPYYQERIGSLPAQQRKIVEYLCSVETAAPVKEIARELFASAQSISSQLKDLRDKGYVVSSPLGRESLYQIAEPLMRITVEVKRNRNQKPLRFLVGFLRAWYDARALARLLANKSLSPSELLCAEHALETNSGDIPTWELFEPSLLVEFRNNPEKARAQYTRVIDSKDGDVPAKFVAGAYLNRGVAYGRLGKAKLEIEDYSEAMDIEGALPDQIGIALRNRGRSYYQLGDVEDAIRDYSRVIPLEGVSPELVSMSHLNRAQFRIEQGNVEDARRDFEAIVGLDGARDEDVVAARYGLARFRMAAGQWSQGLEALEAGLQRGATVTPRCLGDASGLVEAVFELTLDPGARRTRIASLLDVFQRHQGASILAQGLVGHLGMLFRKKADLPDSESLERWRRTWSEATQGIEDFRSPMRIFEVGIDFLQSNPKEKRLLRRLRPEERTILEQALGIGPGGEGAG